MSSLLSYALAVRDQHTAYGRTMVSKSRVDRLREHRGVRYLSGAAETEDSACLAELTALADALGWSVSKLLRLEWSGLIDANDASTLLDCYGVTDSVVRARIFDLLAAARLES